MGVGVWVRACVRVCARVRARARVRACVCAHVFWAACTALLLHRPCQPVCMCAWVFVCACFDYCTALLLRRHLPSRARALSLYLRVCVIARCGERMTDDRLMSGGPVQALLAVRALQPLQALQPYRPNRPDDRRPLPDVGLAGPCRMTGSPYRMTGCPYRTRALQSLVG